MNTLLTIIHGLAVGILVSAPMGPIGMLCIQRTLNKGRLSGLYTGIGAALSDFIYALLAGLGMSIIIDFVEDNEAILQLFGSIVLLGFGIVVLVQLCLRFWLGGVQPGGVVLCIVLFSTPVDSYVSYALNRIADTAVGVLLALLVNYIFPRQDVPEQGNNSQ